MKTRFLHCLIFISGIIIFSGCLKNDDEELQNAEKTKLDRYIKAHNYFTLTKSGLYYRETKKGTGATPTDSDFVLINTSWYLLDSTLVGTNDTVLAKSKGIYPFVSYKGPVKLYLPYCSVAGLTEGIKMMHVGGKAQLVVPSSLAYDGYQTSTIPKYSTLLINVELLRTFSNPVTDDNNFINYYLEDTLQLQPSDKSDGIYLKIDSAGSGDSIVSGDTVALQYKARALDTIFTIGSNKFLETTYVVDQDSIIHGLRAAIGKLRKGAVARAIIPYDMAWGAGGYSGRYPGVIDIPPFTSFYYQLIIVDVKPTKISIKK